MRALIVICAIFELGAVARADKDALPPREIVVSGDAEIKVVPDQVILTFAVDTLDKDLIVAKQQNDDRVKKIMGVTQQFKIEPKHVQTDQITIEPRYENYGSKQQFLGFGVRKSVIICLKDMSKFEALLMALLKAGTNRVDGVQFQTTELRKHRDAARLQAIRAAREKAVALAGELGQKVGRPRSIVENGGGYAALGRSAYGNVQNMSTSTGGGDASSDSGFAPGQISITASVTVRFDLAD
jgi:uncharacterized protein YggE